MCLVLCTKMLLSNSMYMITFIELGRGVLNSIFASKSRYFFPFWRLSMTKSGRCVESKNTLTRFIVNPRNIQTIIHIYLPYYCKQTSIPIYVLIISKTELEWWARFFPIQIDTHLRCIRMFQIEWVLCNTFSVCIIIHHSHKHSVWLLSHMSIVPVQT